MDAQLQVGIFSIDWVASSNSRTVQLRSSEILVLQSPARYLWAVDWNCHDNNIYGKITDWFEVIGKVLEDLDVLRENVYNMDETGVMLCMLDSVKVF